MTFRTIQSDKSMDELFEKLKSLDGVKNLKRYKKEEWLGDNVDVSQLPPEIRRLRLRELNRIAKPIPDNVTTLGQKSPK